MKYNKFIHNKNNRIFTTSAVKFLIFGLTIAFGLFLCAMIFYIIGNGNYVLMIKVGMRIIVISFGCAVFRDVLKSGTDE